MCGRETGTPNQLAGPDTLIQQHSPVPNPGDLECRVFFCFFFLIEKVKKVRRTILHANRPQPEEPIKM